MIIFPYQLNYQDWFYFVEMNIHVLPYTVRFEWGIPESDNAFFKETQEKIHRIAGILCYNSERCSITSCIYVYPSFQSSW
jgi:hypothetical protein